MLHSAIHRPFPEGPAKSYNSEDTTNHSFFTSDTTVILLLTGQNCFTETNQSSTQRQAKEWRRGQSKSQKVLYLGIAWRWANTKHHPGYAVLCQKNTGSRVHNFTAALKPRYRNRNLCCGRCRYVLVKTQFWSSQTIRSAQTGLFKEWKQRQTQLMSATNATKDCKVQTVFVIQTYHFDL